MAIEGFDYQTFAQELAAQANELVPANFQPFQKKYVENTIKNFATLAGEAVYNDESLNFTIEQAMLITQIIAEWSFHKSVDLIKSGILPDYWDGVMQKIAFTIFEISKQTISKGLPQDEILQIVEHHVKTTYETALQELRERKIIDDNVLERATKQSNIDEMMQQMQHDSIETVAQEALEPGNQPSSKILKLASVALLLRQLSQDKVQTILNKFSSNDAQTVIQYMQMPDLENKVDKSIAMKCLQEIKTNLPEPKQISPAKILARMSAIFEKIPKDRVDKTVMKERPEVKLFVSKAFNGEYSQIPSKVANIITQHLEESVS